MWKLSIEDDQGQQTVVNLVRDEYSIGRAEANTIRLTERNVSRSHALLHRQRDQWFLEDLQSYNGVYVNGVRIGGRQELAHGDLVQIGDYRIELTDEALATREQGHRRMATDPFVRRDSLIGQPDRFVMLIGPTQGAEFPLDAERLIIGRGDECDLCINHASVSRVHAEVRKLGDGRYELVDKGSANGVRVNGADLERALLDARDVIELGDVVLKFIPAGVIFRADAEDSKRYTLAGVGAPQQGDPSRLDPRALAAAVGVVLLALVLAFVFTRGPSVKVGAETTEASPHESVLRDAARLADEGDVFGAHERLREIPEESKLADSPEYRRIEAEWADAMLQAALGETDTSKKRAILDEIAQTSSVDANRRGLAAKALGALSAHAIDVAELEEDSAEEVAAAVAPQASGAPLEDDGLDETEQDTADSSDDPEELAAEAPKSGGPPSSGAPRPSKTAAAQPKAAPAQPKATAAQPKTSAPSAAPSPAPLPSGDEPW